MRALYAVVFVLSLAGCAGHDAGGRRVQSPGEATVGTEDARFVFERMRVGDPILVTKETQVAVAAGPQSLFPLF